MNMAIRTLLTALGACLVLATASYAAPLVYEGFSASADGSGDDYQIDATLRSQTDARTGFTGAWGNPLVATNLDFEIRDDSSDFTGLLTGTNGALEIFEARAGISPQGRSISRALSYTVPTEGNFYIAMSWSTADAAPLGFTLDGGSFDIVVSVATDGTVSVSFGGASAVNYNSGVKKAFTDGDWNLLVLQVTEDLSDARYDDVAVWLNPAISGGSLGTPDKDDCRGIVHDLAANNTPTAFTSATFRGTVGTGDEVRFDEFYITTELTDIVANIADTTAPAWTATYPQADTTTLDGFTLRAAINEPGTAYYVVVADGASAPTAAEIKAGTGSSGSGELASGSIPLPVGDTEGTVVISSLSDSTAYDVYFTAEDDESPTPNSQTDVDVQKVDIATPVPDTTAPSWTASYPQVDEVVATAATARAAIDEPGTAYYVVLADGATAPISAEVKAGTGSGGSGVVASGSIVLSAADTEVTATIIGLSASTAYDVWFVAEDDVDNATPTPNLQASPTVVDITTLLDPDTVALFEFTSGSQSSSDGEANTTASDITFGSGISGAAFANDRLEVGGNDTLSTSSATNVETQVTNAVSNDMYFTFTVTIPRGTVTSLTLSYVTSSPYRFGIGVFADKTGFSYPTPDNSLYSLYTDGASGSENVIIPLTGAEFQGLTDTTIEFRVYASDGSTSPTREHRFDDIVLSGYVSTSGSDTTPPSWTAIYPQVNDISATGATAAAAINEPGTAYYVVVADAASAPTAAEVKAGTGSGGSGELASGSISLTVADTENTASIAGLTPGTPYDVWFVAEDDEGTPNLQASPTKVDITTLTAYESWIGSFDFSGLPGADLTATGNSDGDAFANLLEFGFAFDPTVSDGGGTLTIDGSNNITQNGPPQFYTDPVTGQYYLRYTRRTDFVAAGLTYTAQFTADSLEAGAFEDATGGSVVGTGTGAGGVAIEAVAIEFPDAIPGAGPSSGKKARFGRVEVTQAP